MALYRKYRPASFAEVVGQEHVTEPLSVALDSGQINHAYLFSGPRGCGKTSSARILARSLNCVEGPTSTPCGHCDSCVSLAPGGPGNLDVTELDAATHNGVDDMRELRDRAFYAPAESRYRVFIIDEAHMISKEGFNALLKIVEEPPEHLIFIFATTEPEKMLATIRSRTHNYPFRLLTPPAMRGLLERVVAGEGKNIEDAVYPLVVRAGGGSPRDSLSVMDQLLAGSGPEGVTYQRSLALLGVTDAALIDKAVDALADQDQAALFGVVDDVIDAGYDPRRFATDLLDRFRDLLILQAVPDAFDRGLVDAPAGAQEVLVAEAQSLGQATLTRCAALVNEGLAQMRGATSPRLLLEILCARMALPAAGMTVEALAQRVEALEQGRGAGGAGAAGGGAGMGAGAGNPVAAAAGAPTTGSGRRYERPSRKAAAATPEPAQAPESTHAPEAHQAADTSQQQATSTPQQSAPAPAEASAATTANTAETTTEASPAPAQPSGSGAASDTASSGSTAANSATAENSDEDPAIAEARRAREIMDRNRGMQAPAQKPEEQQQEKPEPQQEKSALENLAQENLAQENDETPTQSSADNAATNSAADSAANKWSEILEATKDIDLSAWIAARDARPAEEQPSAEELHVQHHTGALANFVNKNQAVYSEAAEKVLGRAVMVIAGVGNKKPAQTTLGEAPTEDDDPHAGKDEAAPAAAESQPASPIPAEKGLDPREIRSASSSALERARAMAEAHRPVAKPAFEQQAQNAQQKQDKPLTGWKARAEKYRQRHQHNVDNGFNGVPLPPEPPADPWDSGPSDNLPPDFEAQPNNAPQSGQPGGGQVASVNPRRTEEDDILDQIAAGPGEMDHRKPLDIAGELVEKHLGGQRMR